MNKAETAAGALVLAFGVAFGIGAMQFPFLQQGVPGPGFLPLVIAGGIVLAGVSLVRSALREAARAVDWPPRAGWIQVALMAGAMALAILLLEALGFLVVTTLFMAALVYCLGERSWRVLATVPLLSAIALYTVFAVWLRVPLPKGLLSMIG